MRTFNELSQAIFSVRPVDRDGVLFTPTTARYRLDNLDNKEELIAWTALTPSTLMTVSIPGSSNAIIAVNKRRERKVLTVDIDAALASRHIQEFIYYVKNQHFAQVV